MHTILMQNFLKYLNYIKKNLRFSYYAKTIIAKLIFEDLIIPQSNFLTKKN